MDAISRDKIKVKSFKRLLNSFKYAVEGIKYTFKFEQNIIVHSIVMVLVIILGLLLKISFFEWVICIILFGLVIGTELINTSIEALTDLMTDKINPLAKIAKDTASGAVLIFALTSVAAGLLIFVPKIINLFM